MMTMKTVLDVFHETVPTAFGFLVADLGFVMKQDDEYAFTATSPRCDVVVELDWGSVTVSLRPDGSERSVRLSFIVGAMNPDVMFLPRYPWGPDEAREETERQAELLHRYCGQLLEGDFSRWSELEEHQQRVLEQWRHESERLVHEARLKLVRRRARAAFDERRFSEAVDLWSSIAAEDLDDTERRKLDYSRRRLILQPVRRRPRLEGIA